METFPLPELLPIRFILVCIAGIAIVVFLILLLIWMKLPYRSKGRKVLPQVATAICLIAMGLVGYYGIIGNINNTTEIRNAVVHDYNVNVLTFKLPKLTLIVNEKVRECEMRSDDQIKYIVQCANLNGTWTNLDDLKGGS
jgi:hypothetical protein